MRLGYGEAGKAGAKHLLPLIVCTVYKNYYILRNQQRFLLYL